MPKPLEQKKIEGEARNVEWRKLSAKQQLAELNRRLGAGIGAVRQREKLKKESR